MDKIISGLESLIVATGWETAVPKSYGPLHLSFTIIGFLLCGIIAWKLRGISEKKSRVFVFSCGAFLVFLDMYKQLFYHFYVDAGEPGYTWWIFPFQLCNIAMYFCLIAPLLKKGPVQQGMYSFMMLYNLLSGGISFLEPSGMLHAYPTLTAVSLLWHLVLVFAGLFLVFSGRGGDTKKDYKLSTVTFLSLCVVAFLINIICWKPSGGTINMFFIGPANSSLFLFSDIAKNCGWYVSTAIYIPTVCLGAYLLFLLISRLIHPKMKNSGKFPSNQ